jgi:four helix bundle protein
MDPKKLKDRTERFASDVVALCAPLLVNVQAKDIARQLLRAGTAVDANYGSAQRARTHKEFTAKIGVVLDDVSESLGWLTLLKSSKLVALTPLLSALHQESDELTRIFAKSYRTAKSKEADDKEGRKRRKHPNANDDATSPEKSH